MTISENESIAPAAGGDDERMLRAQRVLALVSQNERARADLVAAFDGPGDAMDALRRAADPGTAEADRLAIEELRKLAFGRTTTDAEHQAAANALGRLRDLETIPDDVDAALDRALTTLARTHHSAESGHQPAGVGHQPAGGGSGSAGEIFDFASADNGSGVRAPGAARLGGSGPNGARPGGAGPNGDPQPDSLRAADAGPAPHRRQRARQRLIIAGALAAALLCGALAGIGLTSVFTDTSAAANTHGDLAAADTWFAAEQTAADEIPADLGDTVVRSTSRLVHESGAQGRVWLARAADEGYCLVGTLHAEGYAFTCVDLSQFDKAGLSLTIDDTNMRWDGATLTAEVSGPPIG